MADDATQDLQSIVSVHTYNNGKAEIIVTGPGGTFTLETSINGPTITVKDPERGKLRLKACMSLKTNGHLRGFFIAKKGATPQEDTLVWFPARTKQPAKKRRKKA